MNRLSTSATLRRNTLHPEKALALAASFILQIVSMPAEASSTRTQTFQLEKGWNAIYLAVNPLSTLPSEVFTNSPVDIVAAYDGVFTPRQFSSDTAVNMLSELGWTVWYAPSRPDAFLSGLSAIHGSKPYLVHAITPFQLDIAGTVEPPAMKWQPSAYNLVGFCLNEVAPPSFAEFFSGSPAHGEISAYRLAGGAWHKVLDPENTPMRSGEAFWIHCNGNSDYTGPLDVKTSASNGLVLGYVGDDIILNNRSQHPLEAEVLHLPANQVGLPLAIVVDVIGEEVGIKPKKVPMPHGTWSQPLPPLEAGASIRIPLALRFEKMVNAEGATVLCIKTDIGTETWVPVKGYREGLK